MADCYGADRWERRYGAEPSEAWANVLKDCRLSDIARGLEAAERDSSGTIPTLGQFRAWCREHQAGTFAGASRPFPKLEHMATRSRVGRQWLALMWLDGLRRKPDNVSMDDIDEMLGDADLDEMRAKVREWREHIDAEK